MSEMDEKTRKAFECWLSKIKWDPPPQWWMDDMQEVVESFGVTLVQHRPHPQGPAPDLGTWARRKWNEIVKACASKPDFLFVRKPGTEFEYELHKGRQ